MRSQIGEQRSHEFARLMFELRELNPRRYQEMLAELEGAARAATRSAYTLTTKGAS